MRLLLDTHTLVWSSDDLPRLSAIALAAIQDPANDRVMSAATIWELAIKVGQGKIALSMSYRQWMETAITDLKLNILPITVEYAECLLRELLRIRVEHLARQDRTLLRPS